MTLRKLVVAIGLPVLLVGAYWHWSPYVAMYQMKQAAIAKDGDRFNQFVDYAKLRESFKGQLSARFAETVGNKADSSNEFERAGAALGTMLGLALVDQFVNAMVRPEFVMQSMLEAKIKQKTGGPEEGATAQKEKAEVQWVFIRKGTGRLVAYGGEKGGPRPSEGNNVGFVFDRTGFADWKLVEVRVPS